MNCLAVDRQTTGGAERHCIQSGMVPYHDGSVIGNENNVLDYSTMAAKALHSRRRGVGLA